MPSILVGAVFPRLLVPPLVLVGIIIEYGTYQVAYGTSDSDYMTGYNDGKARADIDWGHIQLHPCPETD